MSLIRADKFLTDRGVAESRTRAAELIRSGVVRINGKIISKPATMVPKHSPFTVEKSEPDYASRGAHKLVQALDEFNISCKGIVALDCGASTGGFTDVMLRRGATKVYAVDVGYGQLHWSLRNDERVVVMERTNLRTMPGEQVEDGLDLVTLDMSFISLKLILEKVRGMLKTTGSIVALIKPQFEAGRGNVGSGGVVRDPEIHRKVLLDMTQWCLEHGFKVKDMTSSPIKGPKGNREFLFHLVSGSDIFSDNHRALMEKALEK